MTTRTYVPADRKAQAKLAADARDLSQEAVGAFAQRVLHRLNDKPRFQSIGRKKYVYVEDVAQAMEQELHSEGGDES